VKETQSSLSRSKWASSLEWIPLLFNATIVLGNQDLQKMCPLMFPFNGSKRLALGASKVPGSPIPEQLREVAEGKLKTV
jgi:hypothetical protein